MANAILNFHFDYLHTSLTSSTWIQMVHNFAQEPTNQNWFLYYSVVVCNSHFKSYSFTFMTFIFLFKCHVSIYNTIDRHFFMIMSCSHHAFICAYQLKANMQEPGDGWSRISRCRPPLSIEPPPAAHWPCGLADAQHKIACPPYSPGPRAPSTF